MGESRRQRSQQVPTWSVVLLGTSSPFLLPTVMRPTRRVPAMEVLMTGMWSASSDSNTL